MAEKTIHSAMYEKGHQFHVCTNSPPLELFNFFKGDIPYGI